MSHRILMITDDPLEVGAVEDALRDTAIGRFQIEAVPSLGLGLVRLTLGGVDAVIVDLALGDGVRAFGEVYAEVPHTPIMVLIGCDENGLAMAAVRQGAQGYLLKGHTNSPLVPQALFNVIQRKAVERSLYQEKTRAEIALNSISDGVICTDMRGNVDYLNIAAEGLTGWSRHEARGKSINTIYKLINGVTREPVKNPVEMVLLENQPMGLIPNAVLIRRDGSEVLVEDSAAPIYDWDGIISGVVTVFHDVTAAHAMSMKMVHLAHHDYLTKLPNRVLLNDRIAQAIRSAKRTGSQLALLFIDLDNFKHINDSLGHAVGDELLKSVTQRLRTCVRTADTVSRQGGDEFVILLADGPSERAATATASKIIAALTLPHVLGDLELHISASIGISIYPEDGLTTEILIKNADMAMYHAKESGRNGFAFFTPDMNVRAVNRQVVEADLRNAIKNGEFILHYQPKVNLDSGKILGAEALLRWVGAGKGMVLPSNFISIAEDCGLIIPIGKWVLREACMQAKVWRDSIGAVPIAVNISALEFRDRNFLDGVRAILDETGMPPELLQLEITESVLMYDGDWSVSILNQLKDIGVTLAIDDFGTGYSSLSYLKRFPIDVLKIDQSFVQGIESAADEGVIVSAVIGMGNSLRKQVVAEGVETQGQLEFLKAKHCEEGQGFFYSRPLSPEDFATLYMGRMAELTGPAASGA